MGVSHFKPSGVAIGTGLYVGGYGSETKKINSSGAWVGGMSVSGALTVTGNLTANNFSGTSSGTNTGDQTITLTGNVTGSGTGTFATTIANSAVTNVMIAANADISGSKIVSASTSAIGVVTISSQRIGGAKTFSDNMIVEGTLAVSSTLSASNLSGTNTGDVTIGTANGLSLAGQALSMSAAASATTGVINQSAQSLAGVKTFLAGAIIKGVSSASNVTAGYIGEHKTARQSTATNVTTTGTYQNIASVELTPGDWDVSGIAHYNLNGATCTAVGIALSVNSGNTSTDHVVGDNEVGNAPPTTNNSSSVSIPGYRISISSTTTVYVKAVATFSVGNPQFRGRISARRVR